MRLCQIIAIQTAFAIDFWMFGCHRTVTWDGREYARQPPMCGRMGGPSCQARLTKVIYIRGVRRVAQIGQAYRLIDAIARINNKCPSDSRKVFPRFGLANLRSNVGQIRCVTAAPSKRKPRRKVCMQASPNQFLCLPITRRDSKATKTTAAIVTVGRIR